MFFRQHPALEFRHFHPPFPNGSDFEVARQGVDCFGTHPVKANGFLKCFAVVFGAGVDFAHHIHHFAQGHAPAIIAHRNTVLGYLDVDLLAVAHHMLVDTIIHDLLDEDVNPIVLTAPVSQFADIHTRTEADVLAPVERADGILRIGVEQLFVFCHKSDC